MSFVNNIDIHQIKKVLPHRFPFLFVDRITEVIPGKKSNGIKNVSITDPYFMGHFPEDPVVPGVLILETMAQVGGFIFVNYFLSEDFEKSKEKVIGFIAGFDRVKFHKFVVPGDVMAVKTELIAQMGEMAKVKAEVSVNNEKVAEGEIIYVFRKTAKEPEESGFKVTG